MVESSKANRVASQPRSKGVGLLVALVALSLMGCPGGGGKSTGSDRDRPATDDKGGDTGQIPPLMDLVTSLPKEKRPEDSKDTLGMTQANEWFANNLVGRQARYSFDKIGFSADDDKKGHYVATFHREGERRHRLFGAQWTVEFETFSVKGLSEEVAKRIRRQGGAEVAFRVKSITFRKESYQRMRVYVEDAVIAGPPTHLDKPSNAPRPPEEAKS